jgi:hypothetical protein
VAAGAVAGLAALAGAGALALVPLTASGSGAAVVAASAVRCVPARLNASAVLAGAGLSVSPLPGSYDASPQTQISLLGAAPSALGGVRVSGSSSGSHPGALRGYSQGDGASFVPARPFRAGETVTVRGSVALASGVKPFEYSFVVAHEHPLTRVRAVHVHASDPNEKQHFQSQPLLQPPAIAVTARSAQTAPGYVFAAPYGGPGASGPMIFDDSGSLVWFAPLAAGTEAANLQVQQLEGRPVLTWWQGYIAPQGFGQGEEILLDSSYRQIGRMHAGNGFKADLHDFQLTPSGTALLTVFNPIACDLSAVGGPRAGAVTDSLFQEVDYRTGLVRREWHSLDHVALGDSYSSARGASGQWPFDYFHLNSLDVREGASTLISARNTWGVYELDPTTGQVLTRIGGRHSDVKLAPGAATAYQHDATRLPDGTISIFDNGAVPKVHSQSRGVLVSVDPVAKTDSVRAQYEHPRPLSSGSQGNLQMLANGDAFMGWGSTPYFSEFSAAGQLLFDAHMHGSYESYRGYRLPWTGTPTAAPSIAASAAQQSNSALVTVYASWNGDTRTASWRVLAGPAPQLLAPVAAGARSGFETAIATPAPQAYVAVQALDASGAVLGTSATIRG